MILALICYSRAELEGQDDDLIIYDDDDQIVYENSKEFLFDQKLEFITKNLTLFGDLGGSIALPCEVKHKEHFTRIWTMRNEKISLGNSVLSEVL